MFSKGPNGGKKLSASPDGSNKVRNEKKKGLVRLARRYALHLGALLVLAAFVLAVIINPAKAGTYTVTPADVLTPATAGTVTTTNSLVTDMDTDDNTNYTYLKDKIAGTKSTLDVDIPMDPAGGQQSKIFKAALAIDAHISNGGFDGLNYYVKMFNGPSSPDIFGSTGNLGTFSTTDGSNDTVTLIETDILKARAFYQGIAAAGSSSPEVKIQNARAFSGNVTTDSTQSELAIDYLAVTFYEDTNNPTAGALTPAQDSMIYGTAAVTLANVLDNGSANESGIKQVQFYYSTQSAPTTWISIGSDSTPDASNNYSVNWDTTLPATPDGYYNLKAVVYDNVDNQLEKSTTNIQVLNADGIPPEVSISNPAPNSKVNSPTITPSATDNIGVTKVEFFNSTNPAVAFFTDSDPAGGWTAVWNTSDTGTYIEGNPYQVWAKAFDAANNSAESAHVTYIIDRDAPMVSTSPIDGSTGIPSDQHVVAAFSEDMDWSTITTASFTLEGDISGVVAGTVSTDPPSKTATFIPENALAVDTFTAHLTTAVKDQAGNSLADTTWRFTTADTASPVVNSINPGNNAMLKLETREISAAATDNVGVTKVEFYWQYVPTPGSWTKFGEDTTSGDGWKASLNTASLPGEGQYDIKVLAYDAAGTTPGQLIVRYGVDKTLPQVNSVSPFNGTTGVWRTPSISAVFSEDMDPSSFIENDTVYLTRYGSFEVVNTKLSYNPMTRTATMVMPFGSYLNYSTTYMATVAAAVYDLAGNRLNQDKTWSFTTEIDLIPPKSTVTDVNNPYISPVNVDDSKDNVRVTFNIDQESTVHMEVFDAVGTMVYSSPEVFVLAGNGHALFWNGRNDANQFVVDGTYTLRIVAVDPSGNVGRAKVKPAIVVDNTSPWARTAVAESRTKIKLTYSEPMDINSAINPFYYVIAEKDNPGVTLSVDQVTMVDNMSVLITTLTAQKTNRTNYIITIGNVDGNVADKQGNPIQSPTTVEFTGFIPHGLYTQESSYCSNCHITHTGDGKKLINSTAIKELCYNCHGSGGQSTYNNIDVALGKTGSGSSVISVHPVEKMPQDNSGLISCENCHDTHGTINPEDGKLYPKLLRSKNTETTQVYSQGNAFCWACHGSDSTLLGKYGDKQTYYPAYGEVHNDIDWEPSDPNNNTRIRCAKCHLPHGSNRATLFPDTVNGVSLSSVGNCICCTCHNDNPNEINFNYNGRNIYTTTNPHGSRRCVVCHDAHTQQVGKLLERSFVQSPTADEVVGSTYYEAVGDYNLGNYQTCSTSTCHPAMAKLTQKTKDYDVVSETYSIPTTFWSENVTEETYTNLHEFHLNLSNYRPGYGDATCKECHRIHGSLAVENPQGYGRGKSLLVGFPMRGPAGVVANAGYEEPVWNVIVDTEVDPAGGTCNLTCHGKEHNEVTYLAGAPAPQAQNKDQDCYGCHSDRETSDRLEIAAWMGYYGQPNPAGVASRHIAANVDKDLAGKNGCLTECHTEHSNYTKYANNTLGSTWNDLTNTMTNDELLCQNTYCHTTPQAVAHPDDPDQNNRAPAISNLFTSTLHGNYERTYHDYDVADPSYVNTPDGSKYMGNCLKCHNPHGSFADKLLKFNPGSTEPEVGGDTALDLSVNSGNNNSVCFLCHVSELGNTPLFEGEVIYTQTNHGNRLLQTGDVEPGHCDSCHDPHGQGDPASGNPPTQLYPDMLINKGNELCYVCHTDPDSLTIPDWPGKGDVNTGYLGGAHNSVAHTTDTGYCGICHSTHGADPTSSGVPVKELLWQNEEATCFDGSLAGNCHGTGDSNKDIQTVYGKSFPHGNIGLSGKHSSTERTMPVASRHAECEDCHNSHSAKATAAPVGTNAIKPSEVNVWGITPAEPWPAPAAGTIASPATWIVVENAQYEWQICAKCHSKWAYGTSSATIPDTTTWGGAVIDQTDTMAEFNPNNYGHHAVVTQGKNQPGAINPNFANTFVSGWGPTSTLACSDCHSSDGATDAKGTHGSNFKYILAQNNTGIGTAAVFCYNCHSRDVYADDGYTPINPTYSRWSHPDNSNHASAGNSHVSGIWCLNCHMGNITGGSHGSNDGPGAGLKDGTYTNQPLGRRLMNGSNMTSYNTKAGNIACYAAQVDSSLSNCSKSHNGQNDATNYDY